MLVACGWNTIYDRCTPRWWQSCLAQNHAPSWAAQIHCWSILAQVGATLKGYSSFQSSLRLPHACTLSIPDGLSSLLAFPFPRTLLNKYPMSQIPSQNLPPDLWHYPHLGLPWQLSMVNWLKFQLNHWIMLEQFISHAWKIIHRKLGSSICWGIWLENVCFLDTRIINIRANCYQIKRSSIENQNGYVC